MKIRALLCVCALLLSLVSIVTASAQQRPNREQILNRMQQRGTYAGGGYTAGNMMVTAPGVHYIPHDGMNRTYSLFIPPGYNKNTPLPLVIVLHGGGGNADISERMTQFVPLAKEKNFILVHPNGTGSIRNALLTWNAGNCCGYAHQNDVDDVGFIGALIDAVSRDFSVDPKRIYVAGMSNGGKMSYRLACFLSDRIAAIAPVAGSMEEPDCAPTSPISVIAFHGTADERILYEGGTPKKSADTLPRTDNSVKESVGYWARNNQCDPLPQKAEAGSVVRERYSGCLDGTEVELYTILGGVHAWPGGEKIRDAADTPTQEISATKTIIEFFLAHPKK